MNISITNKKNTIYQSPPETLRDQQYNKSSDMWTLGCTL
jgi:serine/threonine protein kinase